MPDPALTSSPTPLSRIDIVRMMGLSFDAMPANTQGEAYGVKYVRLDEPDGGQLYITRYGWRFIDHILPDQWYHDQAYLKRGKKLPRATSAVYRVPTWDTHKRRTDLVVRFSRLAQDVPLMLSSEVDMQKEVAPEERYHARFNSPFEEFGRLFELKREPTNSELPRILTKRPLAIYSPGREQPVWKFGRHKAQFTINRSELQREQQTDAVHAHFDLDIKRDYIMVYQWIKGIDAEVALNAGLIDEKEVRSLTKRVNRELRARGFRVLDNKPRHFIVRVWPRTGQLLRRHGKIAYGLIDFELLERINR